MTKQKIQIKSGLRALSLQQLDALKQQLTLRKAPDSAHTLRSIQGYARAICNILTMSVLLQLAAFGVLIYKTMPGG